GHWGRQIPKDCLAVVGDLAGLAMHEFRRANHLATECGTNRLMSQTHSQQRYLGGESPDQFNADSSLLWSARPRRQKNPVRTHPFHIRHRKSVIAPDYNFFAQLTQVLHQVVGKGIVVVENENHIYRCCARFRLDSSLPYLLPSWLLRVAGFNRQQMG